MAEGRPSAGLGCTVDQRGIPTLLLDRPAQHNRLVAALIEAMTTKVDRLSGDPTVRALVLAATGPSFCAGADLAWMAQAAGQGETENVADVSRLARLLKVLDEFPAPTLAVVRGPAFRGGLGLPRGAPQAQRDAKQLVALCLSETNPERLRGELAHRLAAYGTPPEAREGIKAFLEKRLPDWRTS